MEVHSDLRSIEFSEHIDGLYRFWCPLIKWYKHVLHLYFCKRFHPGSRGSTQSSCLSSAQFSRSDFINIWSNSTWTLFCSVFFFPTEIFFHLIAAKGSKKKNTQRNIQTDKSTKQRAREVEIREKLVHSAMIFACFVHSFSDPVLVLPNGYPFHLGSLKQVSDWYRTLSALDLESEFVSCCIGLKVSLLRGYYQLRAQSLTASRFCIQLTFLAQSSDHLAHFEALKQDLMNSNYGASESNANQPTNTRKGFEKTIKRRGKV